MIAFRAVTICRHLPFCSAVACTPNEASNNNKFRASSRPTQTREKLLLESITEETQSRNVTRIKTRLANRASGCFSKPADTPNYPRSVGRRSGIHWGNVIKNAHAIRVQTRPEATDRTRLSAAFPRNERTKWLATGPPCPLITLRGRATLDRCNDRRALPLSVTPRHWDTDHDPSCIALRVITTLRQLFRGWSNLFILIFNTFPSSSYHLSHLWTSPLVTRHESHDSVTANSVSWTLASVLPPRTRLGHALNRQCQILGL